MPWISPCGGPCLDVGDPLEFYGAAIAHVRDFSSHWASATHMEKGRVVISFLKTEKQE